MTSLQEVHIVLHCILYWSRSQLYSVYSHDIVHITQSQGWDNKNNYTFNSIGYLIGCKIYNPGSFWVIRSMLSGSYQHGHYLSSVILLQCYLRTCMICSNILTGDCLEYFLFLLDACNERIDSDLCIPGISNE